MLHTVKIENVKFLDLIPQKKTKKKNNLFV